MAIKIYKTDTSPPCRSVLMTLELLGLKFEFEEVRPMYKETQTPEYLAKNPEHTVPFLEDGDFQLGDSHAIITYLVSKYGGEHKETLYPSDLEVRATIDHRLFLDTSVLYPKLAGVVKELIGSKKPDRIKALFSEIKEAYGILEIYLTKREFFAANHLTLADIALVATVSGLQTLVPLNGFPKIKAWFEKMQQYKWYQTANSPGAERISQFFQSSLKSIGL